MTQINLLFTMFLIHPQSQLQISFVHNIDEIKYSKTRADIEAATYANSRLVLFLNDPLSNSCQLLGTSSRTAKINGV